MVTDSSCTGLLVGSLGLKSNLVRAAAKAHEIKIVSSGVGYGASATMDELTVTNLAVTLQMPKTLPMTRSSK